MKDLNDLVVDVYIVNVVQTINVISLGGVGKTTKKKTNNQVNDFLHIILEVDINT